MKLQLIRPKYYVTGCGVKTEREPHFPSITFDRYKFNNRPQPTDKHQIMFVSSFSEFGSEVVSVLYSIPWLLRNKYLGVYTIALGWQGREFFYRHLTDEYWESPPEAQCLREYTRAFHHESRNLKGVERWAETQGRLMNADHLGWAAVKEIYPKGLEAKKEALWLPDPRPIAVDKVSEFRRDNAVGVFARNRACYGRNFSVDFYQRLTDLLVGMGYSPLWMGEPSAGLPVPKGAVDFRTSAAARDLEASLALVKSCRFTIQFYTASTRLAGLVGTPYLLFESPDQIYGRGQEGIRLKLCSRGAGKLVLADYKKLAADESHTLKLVEMAVTEMGEGDYNDIVDSVERFSSVFQIRSDRRREALWT